MHSQSSLLQNKKADVVLDLQSEKTNKMFEDFVKIRKCLEQSLKQ